MFESVAEASSGVRCSPREIDSVVRQLELIGDLIAAQASFRADDLLKLVPERLRTIAKSLEQPQARSRNLGGRMVLEQIDYVAPK